MDRYRRYGDNDDSPMQDGDTDFRGVNSFDSPENLKPGEVQEAVNCDMTRGTAATRGGFVCVPTLGASAFGTVYASGSYSDPLAKTEEYVVLAGASSAGFYAFGQAARTIAYPGGYTISKAGTVVQAGNYLFIFPGEGQTPIRWDGDWSGAFEEVPNSSGDPGFESIPESNQATYYQNRLWVVNGKDRVAASEVLDFTEYDEISNDFNLNTGDSDYVVKTYPFGTNGLVVFKSRSSIMLQHVEGSLGDVTATEITRQLGIIGINACVTSGPDLLYMSDRNITSVRLNLQNQLQAVTEPLSRNIKSIMDRVHWERADKVSMGYWDNNLYVALPLDNSNTCNAIVVYNFITNQWWGEWTFNDSLNMDIQGFVVANYFGEKRLHVVTEEGRVFATGEGQNDIRGSNVYEILMSVTTRPYVMDNNSKIGRRMWLDASTNRPQFSVTAYVEGANEYQTLISNQTYLRSQTWLFGDTTYTMDNTNDDYNRAFRKDYASGPDSIKSGTGFLPEMRQTFRLPLISRRKGRMTWFKVSNTQGYIEVDGVGNEARAGDRLSLTQVG